MTRFCERHEISQSVFYESRRLAIEVGPVGTTEPGSRRPHALCCGGTLVAEGEPWKAAVQVVSTAIRRWGVPQRLLLDNGLAFNPTRRGFTGKLVDYLLDLGVKPITGKPGRPRAQGKNERFHQTLHKWLSARPPRARRNCPGRGVGDHRPGTSTDPRSRACQHATFGPN